MKFTTFARQQISLIAFPVLLWAMFITGYSQTTSFTYQGKLNDGGSPAGGSYDMQFKLFDALTGGTQIGSTNSLTNLSVAGGIFSVSLDFGAAAFPGANRWLEISVRLAGGGAFTTLTPRSPITSTPYAIRSQNAATATTADGLSAACAGCVTSAQINNINSSQISGTIAGSQIAVPLSLTGLSHGAPILTATNTGLSSGLKGVNNASTGLSYGVEGETFSSTGAGVYGVANGSVTANAGVSGLSKSSNGAGVRGIADSNTGGASGVFGQSNGNAGKGVYGKATSTTGATFGVYGEISSGGGAGVFGTTSTTGSTSGVYGSSPSDEGRGVSGIATSTTGTTFGVFGQSQSSDGRGVFGFAGGTTGANYGVFGQTTSNSGRAVHGLADSSTGTSYGVSGESRSNEGIGAMGIATSLAGATRGVQGSSASNTGIGVYGHATSTAPGLNNVTYGVYGLSESPDGNEASGVFGESKSSLGNGVLGLTSHNSSAGSGVLGVSSGGGTGGGVYGLATHTSGFNYGVYGETRSPAGVGVVARGAGVTGTALQIGSGAIKVTGAGVGSNTAVFIHQATAGNIVGHYTIISHPMTDNSPNAILIITPNWKPGGGSGGVYNNKAIGVFYNGSNWAIFNQDFSPMPVDAAFNVLIVKP